MERVRPSEKPVKLPHKIALAVTFFVLASAVFWLTNWSVTQGFQRPPGVLRADPARYVNLGLTMSQGRGLYADFSHPAYRQAYEKWNSDGAYDLILRQRYSGTTIFSPPGMPILLGGFYRVFGFQPGLSRTVALFSVALAVSLAAMMALSRAGYPAAILLFVAMVSDGRLQYYAGEVHSEGPAALLLLAACSLWYHSSKPAISLLAGVLTGGLILLRTNVLLWVPFLVIHVGLKLRNLDPQQRAKWARNGILFLTGASLAVVPMVVRTYRVTGREEFLPTNGRTSLPGAYCDESYQNWGLSDPLVILVRQKELIRSEKLPPDVLLREKRAAANGQKLALNWANENLEKLPILFVMRCLNHLQLYPWMGNEYIGYVHRCVVLLLFFLALLRAKPNSFERFVGTLLLADLVITGLTWGVDGRLFVPMLPLVYLCAVTGPVPKLWLGRADTRG